MSPRRRSKTADPERQRYELVRVSRLKEHPDNPRRGDVNLIGQSIAHNGFFGALVVQKSTRFVLAGNHTLRAARNAGMATISVLWVDVDDDRARKILLVDNAASDAGTYDAPALANALKEFVGYAQMERDITAALIGTGYNAASFEGILARASMTPEKKTPAKTPEHSYIVAVECPDEASQRALADRLKAEGFHVTARRLAK